MATQWRVTWFPPDRYQVRKEGLSEESVRRLAQENVEWFPIIERREVGDWEGDYEDRQS